MIKKWQLKSLLSFLVLGLFDVQTIVLSMIVSMIYKYMYNVHAYIHDTTTYNI